MNITWNGKIFTYTFLVVLLFLLVMMSAKGSYRLGNGLAFNDWMVATGTSSADWQAMSESAKDSIRNDMSAKAIPYAALMTASNLCMALLILVSTAYTFRERFFSRRNATLVAIGLCAVAGFFSGASAVYRSQNSDAWLGGIGIAVVLFVVFYILTGILGLIRKATLGITKSDA